MLMTSAPVVEQSMETSTKLQMVGKPPIIQIHAGPHLGDKTSRAEIKSQTGYIKLRHKL